MAVWAKPASPLGDAALLFVCRHFLPRQALGGHVRGLTADVSCGAKSEPEQGDPDRDEDRARETPRPTFSWTKSAAPTVAMTMLVSRTAATGAASARASAASTRP